MSHAEILAAAQEAVDHLLGQYNDYLKTITIIDELKSEQMTTAIRLAEAAGTSFLAVLQENPDEIREISARLSEAEHELNQISDEMTFANPVIWMMYKHQAYVDTSKAIVDMEDLRIHCRPVGYICSKRYHFLRSYLREVAGLDIDDNSSYPDAMSLSQIYSRPEFVSLSTKEDFLSQWRNYEYHNQEQRVAKWENYSFGG